MELCFCFYDLVNNVLVIAGYITGPMRETLLTLSQLGDTGDLSLSLQGRDSTGEEEFSNVNQIDEEFDPDSRPASAET